MNERLKAALALILLVLVSAGILAGTNTAVHRIAVHLATAGLQLEDLVAPFSSVIGGDQFAKVREGDVEYRKVFREGEHVGYIIEVSSEGYGFDPIVLIVGAGTDLVVTGVAVLSHDETPGLGGRVFSEENLAQFTGQGGGAEIRFDGVSGATYSSSGVLSGVRKGIGTLAGITGPRQE
jgi:Na+-translocating ferredoxin:NAD+ oxidoreductase RnfG subunit